jgi:hypothetical protein
MRSVRRKSALILAVLGGLAVTFSALPNAGASTAARLAPRPGQWTQVTTKLTSPTDIGLARGEDGVLHVIWTTGSTGSLRVSDTPISPKGTVGRPVTIASHLFSASDPDATVTSHSVAAFWDEVQSNSPSSPVGIAEATRPARGGSWRTGAVTPTAFDWLSSVAAAPGTNGSTWVDYENSNGIAVHHSGDQVQELSYPACCVIEEGIGTDSKTGTGWATYLSEVPGHGGLFAQKLTSAGQRSGSPLLLPGSGTNGSALVIEQRLTATGLGGSRPGVYVTYRTGGQAVAHHLELYRLGAKAPVSLASFTLTDQIGGSTLAADPFGRLWVAWFRVINDRPLLSVRRAKSEASQFGQAATVTLPKGTSNVTEVYLNAQAKRLDVLALLTVHGKTAYWTTQVLPPKQ